MSRRILVLLTLFVILAAVGCAPAYLVPSGAGTPVSPPVDEIAETAQEDTGMGMGMGMGPGSGMMARHHAVIPDEYAGLTNPIAADEASLLRGAATYDQYCATCHGEGGMGDGPAGQTLDPQPAPVAHTSRMLGDDYLYWRISEGGAHEPFTSAMPRWQDVLDENDRWDVINFVRALGSGQPLPGRGPRAGETFDPAAEAARHAQMAADGVEQGVLSQVEADTFLAVHDQLDQLMAAEIGKMSGSMATMQEELLSRLVADGAISAAEAQVFNEAHEKLLAAGLMQ